MKGALNHASDMMSWLSAKAQLYIPEARDVIVSKSNEGVKTIDKDIAQSNTDELARNIFNLNKRERA